MIVMSMKWTLKKILVAVGIFLVLVLAVVWMLGGFSKGGDTLVSSREDRIGFLKSLGWEADPESEKEREVIIPESFDEIFESYNALQKKAGFDLEAYKGKTVKKYTYQILNYPSAEKDDIIKADLLVSDGRVIGGDVYSPKLDGFIIGLLDIKDVEG